jgi:hypothetical protein
VKADRTSMEARGGYFAEPPMDPATRESLMVLAEDIESVLVPVQPAREFKESLRDQLLALMRDRVALSIAGPSESRRRALILGATLGSLVPLCGAAAYLLRSRFAGKPQHAASH